MIAPSLILIASILSPTLEIMGETTCTADIDATQNLVIHNNNDVTISVLSDVVCDQTDPIDPPPPVEGECENIPSILTKDENVKYFIGNDFTNRFASSYEEFFGTWPLSADRNGRNWRIQLMAEDYISWKFTVPVTGGSNDKLAISVTEGLAQSGGTVISVSSCEGGILQSESLDGCWTRTSEIAGSLDIGVNPATSECVVERGKTYYFNLANYNEDTDMSTCDFAVCEILMRGLGIGAVGEVNIND